MKILKLIEQDFMRVDALEIDSRGRSLVILQGPNQSGKTSALRAITSALGGGRYDPEIPVRLGEDSSEIEIELGEGVASTWKVTVDFTPKGQRGLTVKKRDEKGIFQVVNKPQTVLSELIGPLTFDPLQFLRAKKEDRRQMVIETSGKSQLYDNLNADRKKRLIKRAELDRAAKQKTEQIEAHKSMLRNAQLDERFGLVEKPMLTKVAEEELAKFHLSLEEINQNQRERNAAEIAVSKAAANVEGAEAEVERLKVALAQAGERLKTRKREAEETKTKLASVGGDDEAIRRTRETILDQIEKAKQAQAAGKIVDVILALRKQQDPIIEDIKANEADIQKIDAQKTALVDEVFNRLGVKNAKIDPETEEIVIGDIPLSQTSGMVSLIVSAKLAMAMNNRLRVMLIDEGDKLDAKAIESLVKLAKEQKYQIWMTAVYAGTESADAMIVRMKDGESTDAALKNPIPKRIEKASMKLDEDLL